MYGCTPLAAKSLNYVRRTLNSTDDMLHIWFLTSDIPNMSRIMIPRETNLYSCYQDIMLLWYPASCRCHGTCSQTNELLSAASGSLCVTRQVSYIKEAD